ELLVRRGLFEAYSDYWLAYPLIFESNERVMASVSSGGYNRFPPYAYFVSVSQNPAFVFVRDSPADVEFQTRLAAQAAHATRESVSIYQVYSDVNPLAGLRP